jgi:hypothetical protein
MVALRHAARRSSMRCASRLAAHRLANSGRRLVLWVVLARRSSQLVATRPGSLLVSRPTGAQCTQLDMRLIAYRTSSCPYTSGSLVSHSITTLPPMSIRRTQSTPRPWTVTNRRGHTAHAARCSSTELDAAQPGGARLVVAHRDRRVARCVATTCSPLPGSAHRALLQGDV